MKETGDTNDALPDPTLGNAVRHRSAQEMPATGGLCTDAFLTLLKKLVRLESGVNAAFRGKITMEG